MQKTNGFQRTSFRVLKDIADMTVRAHILPGKQPIEIDYYLVFWLSDLLASSSRFVGVTGWAQLACKTKMPSL